MKKFKAWLINKLGGYTDREVEDIVAEATAASETALVEAIENIQAAKNALTEMQETTEKLRHDRRAVDVIIPYAAHPLFGRDEFIERSEIFVQRQIGKALYPYAQHFLTEDAYIAVVEFCAPEGVDEHCDAAT